MKIMEIFAEKAKDNMNKKSPVIAFLGDSVTQGCFELYRKNETGIETVFDKNCAYHNYIARIFSVLYPSVPVNIINAGISGDRAPHAVERLERDVLCHNPDLVVVCFALNDVCDGIENIEKYAQSLDSIFKALLKKNIEVIFMTPNMMNTYTDYSITDDEIKMIADLTANRQNSGDMDKYIDKAKEVCENNGVVVCDCYAKWKKLYENGVNVTELLANKMNHPTRDMNWLFAYSLVETMMG